MIREIKKEDSISNQLLEKFKQTRYLIGRKIDELEALDFTVKGKNISEVELIFLQLKEETILRKKYCVAEEMEFTLTYIAKSTNKKLDITGKKRTMDTLEVTDFTTFKLDNDDIVCAIIHLKEPEMLTVCEKKYLNQETSFSYAFNEAIAIYFEHQNIMVR